MKALLLRSPGDFSVVERPDPVAAEDEAIIRVFRTGICATDVATIEGRSTVAVYPITPGHEFVGTVESAPPGKGFAAGEWVTIYPTQGCGKCPECVANRPNHCRKFRVFGVHRDGGSFAERMAIPLAQLIKVPASLQNDHGALIEPLAVGVHANRRAGVAANPQRRIGVIGAGAVGTMVAQVARAHGASEIVIADRLEGRRKLCHDLGFDRFVVAGTPGWASELRLPGGPLDLVFDNACSRETIAAAVDAMRPGGTLVLLGFPHDGADIPLAYVKAYQQEVSILLSRNYEPADFTEAISLLEGGHINAARMVTGTWPLASFADAYAALKAAPERHVKILLAP